MPDIPPGWASLISAIIVALLGGGGGVIATVVSLRTRRTVNTVAADTRDVKDQVKNSHKTNLRAEQDTRHDELVQKLDAITTTQSEHGRSIDRLSDDVSRLAAVDLEQARQAARERDRVDALFNTSRRPPHNTQKEQHRNGN